ncbi:Endochitinase 46 [Ceratocystis fimbriata CBS 114723]|uniref:chitinase n=1 Tax=Ceratocystis fimbriata CBS 114723 TaxID=1035309 RepID=A0A2C5X211_9PEZI|nr:Endochitinase 46 [Ceratocystis fimbriata CBS 114723]
MLSKSIIASVLAAASSIVSVAAAPSTNQYTGANVARGDVAELDDGFMNLVYYTDWSIGERQFKASQMTADKLTHVNFAFLQPMKDGSIIPGNLKNDVQEPLIEGETQPYTYEENGVTKYNALGCVKDLFMLKQKNRQLKTLISIGGWTWSDNFTDITADEAKIDLFAQQSVKYMADWGFDGVDIDWEYPKTKEEGASYITLLKRVRKELDDYAEKVTPNYHYLLTIAAPAGPSNYQQLDMKGLGEVLDYVNLMAYDYAGSWSTNSGYLANVYPSKSTPTATDVNTEAAVNAYIDGGVPAHKMILGMPIYGRSFEKTEGIGMKFEGVGGGTWEPGAYDYKVLPLDGAEEKFDEETLGQYSYDAAKKQLISYDTPQVVAKKVEYLRNKGLGGSMFWEASADKIGEASLIATSYNALERMGSPSCSENQLHYPNSMYSNIATGIMA